MNALREDQAALPLHYLVQVLKLSIWNLGIEI
uniref:Uncharacterized protein n=1 Tax=Arundo donax TaxID=35708 RepID=A0A0A8YL73_ARUDO